MSATGKATNELGKLFVDIGLGGVGTALKGLNSISASFLLTKNAATQAVKPLFNFGQQAADSAVQIGKMSAQFGFTMTEYQKLIRYFKDHKLSENLVGDLTNLSNQFTKFQKYGINAFSPEQLLGASELGINLMNYTGSIQDMMRLMEDVQRGINQKGLDADSARIALQQMGLAPEWLYAFQRGDFSLRDAMSIPDSEIENMIDLEEKWQETVNDLRTLGREFVMKYAPALKNIIEKLEPVVDKLAQLLAVIPTNKQEAEVLTQASLKTWPQLRNQLYKDHPILANSPILGNAIHAIDMWHMTNNRALNPDKAGLEIIRDLNGTSGDIPLPALPATAPKGDIKITIHNENKIDANNPGEVAKAIVDINQRDILNSLMNKAYRDYEGTNNSGL